MSPQSYYVGGKIRAADFNEFIGNINNIVGIGTGDSGYGQDSLVIAELAPTDKMFVLDRLHDAGILPKFRRVSTGSFGNF